MGQKTYASNGHYLEIMTVKASALALALLLILISTHANALTPAVNSTHFVIYDLANAGQTYDQELDNYLEQAYSLYTSNLGMKMAPPCSGSQYTVYVVPSINNGTEAGITEWKYTYYPNTGQIINACIAYINISAGLSTQWLEHTAYHELVHVSQWAYVQYTAIPQDYPWYIEADAEGTASYYTNQCPLDQDYFMYNQYEYDPYDYYGKPIINMYYYSAFIYWLISNGIGPATIEANVFAGDSVVNSWLDNYYVQYLLSIVHGQDLCGTTYTPTFQTISIGGNTYTFTVSLQGLSAQYYELQLPASGSIEISTSGGIVDSNIQLNTTISTSNTTLYVALVNPTTSSETITVTISYTPGIVAEVLYGTYDVLNETLSLKLYITYGTTPINGDLYVNGTIVAASNGYAKAMLTGITWGTYTINITYNGESTLLAITLQQPSMNLLTQSTLYLTSNSFGYIILSVNNPNNNIVIITNVQVSSPPSPINIYKPMIYFEPPNETVLLNPGQTIIKFYFFTNSTVGSGQGDLYLYNSPSTALSLGYNVVPAQVGIVNATYYLNGNYTVVTTYVSGLGTMTATVDGLSGQVYVNYSTYTITTLSINLPSPSIALIPRVALLAPRWVLINTTVTLTAQECPSYPVFYRAVIYVNNSEIGSISTPCGESGFVQGMLNMTYTGQSITLVISGTTIMSTIVFAPPSMSVVDYLWNVTETYEYVYVNISVHGPYQYLVLNHRVANSTIAVTYELPSNYTILTINTGFTNITITRPTPETSIQSPWVAVYPQAIDVHINVTIPPALMYQGPLYVYLNGTQSLITTVDLPPGKSTIIDTVVKPTAPGIYLVTVALGPLVSNNITVASVELLGIHVESKPLVLIGHQEYVNITINDIPSIELPINVTLRGCTNESITVIANTSLALQFNRECPLYINASTYTLSSQSISYWDALNVWLGNVVSYYDGEPLILNGTVEVYATFLNGSRVPAPVLVNGSSTYILQSPGPSSLLLSINYLGVVNESLVRVFVVPSTYVEAEELLNSLGNPQFLNATIASAITSGDWSLVNKIVTEYQEASSRPYDPLTQLSKYLLTQAILNGNLNGLNAASLILKYEMLMYTALASIIIAVVVAYRVTRKSRKS